MGIPDSSLLDLIEKVRSWISRGPDSSVCLSKEFVMTDNSCKMCCECDISFHKFSLRYQCQSCDKLSCGKCIQGYESYVVESDGMRVGNEVVKRIKSCKFCFDAKLQHEGGRRHNEKVHPSVSPRDSPEPPSPSYDGANKYSMKTEIESIPSDHISQYLESQDCGYSPYAASRRILSSFSAHPSPITVRHSPNWSDEEDAEDSGRHFFSPLSDYFRDSSDIESSSISARNEFCSSHFEGSSPSDSPSRNDYTSNRTEFVVQTVQSGQGGDLLSQSDGSFSQETTTLLNRPEKLTEGRDSKNVCSGDLPTVKNQDEKLQRPLDFENNGLIWFPPPPDDENDESGNNFFAYDDEDDNIGDSGAMFSKSSSFSSVFPTKENLNEENKEPLRAMVQGHFRALVAQLLQGEDIKSGGDSVEDWLDVITTIAWQAANFVRPDTSRGGSMDPGDYVKVKCVATGSPHESSLIKGVVCTKNIKHKRMTSQFKNPRLLLLGGSLEYHQVPNQLASFNTLLHQENNHLKTIISKIESLRPNVLLVEKSVSSCAQEYLLAKEISLVLNVKKPLLERIARCTGALITPSIDHISTARLGHCELFRLERVHEEHGNINQNKKLLKTLMFFEGCPRRLGCTVLLKGMCREELKKVKHVVQYAVFAAYHLSLETSFLADEGASLPKMPKHCIAVEDNSTSEIPNDPNSSNCLVDDSARDKFSILNPGLEESKIFSIHGFEDSRIMKTLHDAYNDDLPSDVEPKPSNQWEELKDVRATVPFTIPNLSESEFPEIFEQKKGKSGEIQDPQKSESIDDNDLSSDYFSATDTHQSILVSFSSHCVLKGTVCERSRLLRIKFYGRFDKPLGRYLRDDLFDQTSSCRSCKESAEAHVLCYTHQQGNLTINVRRLPSIKLPGEQDGKIWMWHRCLRCAQIDGVPPATPRVVMSDAAWGLSFGKFLELSFSNHATANRIATCGHSLQRDCLRFYGFGNMVAFFRYSPIDILSVNLPPSVLEFNSHIQQEWIAKEASELISKMESLYAEISDIVDRMEQKGKLSAQESSDLSEMQSHILQLKELLQKERNDYIGLLQPFVMETSLMGMISVDILELNRLRRSLLIHSYFWDHRLYSLDSLLKRILNPKTDVSSPLMKDLKSDSAQNDGKLEFGHDENVREPSWMHESAGNDLQSEQKEESIASECSTSTSLYACREETLSDGELNAPSASFGNFPSSHGSSLSERIDCAWSGTENVIKPQPISTLQAEELPDGAVKQVNQIDNPHIRRLVMSPVRVHSFDSAIRMQERIRKGLPPSTFHLSTIRSFHASGDFSGMVRDPVSSLTRVYSPVLPWETQKLNLLVSSTLSFISSASHVAEGVRLLLPQTGNNDIVIAVYDNEPTSIIAYALNSREYDDWVAGKSHDNEGGQCVPRTNAEDSMASTLSAWQSFGSLDLDYIHYGSYSSEDSSSLRTLFSDPKKSPHLRISFGDESSTSGGRVKFSVTCYFAKQFDLLRKKCCPKEVDFVRSLSRCRRWTAQGGKSNVYFAKSLDERFIIKQVTRTELDSFEEFAPEYFKYLTDSLTSGSPTCLAKILGIYQVSVKHLKGGKEMKMDLMVMENLFFKRNISNVYDLKGSSRARYNPDTTGANKVLLDLNLVEALRTKPLFLGSKAKRSLERAIWNDTAFLASVDVMDYSLLVGIDEERKELVLGIIDFMRQYTWDKHLETWVKASGILGGPKNASPTIISPKQYKKRFRKAMTAYFVTVPDQWAS